MPCQRHVRRALEGRLHRKGEWPLADSEWEDVKPSAYEIDDPILEADSVFQRLVRLRGQRPGARRERPLYDSSEVRRAEKSSRANATDLQLVSFVETARASGFGSTAVPFLDRDKLTEWVEARAIAGDKAGPDDEANRVRLHFVGRNGLSDVSVKADSVLGKLQRFSAPLANWLGCSEALAVDYILTGEIPLVMPVTGLITPHRIELRVNYPWVRPDSVRKAYALAREFQRGLPGITEDEPSPRVRSLLEFLASTEGLRHAERYETWAAKYPEWPYETLDSFRAACSKASRRWRGR